MVDFLKKLIWLIFQDCGWDVWWWWFTFVAREARRLFQKKRNLLWVNKDLHPNYNYFLLFMFLHSNLHCSPAILLPLVCILTMVGVLKHFLCKFLSLYIIYCVKNHRVTALVSFLIVIISAFTRFSSRISHVMCA